MIFTMRIMPLLLALAAAAPAAAAERRYTVTDFDRIEVDGPFQVSLTTGLAAGARAVGSQGAIDRLSVEVQGRTLRIRVNRSSWGGYPGDATGPVRIEATTRELRSGAVLGSGGLAIDKAKGLRVDLSVSGSGQVSLANADTDNLIVGLLGSGQIRAAGRTKQLKATIQGSGDFDGAGLKSDDANIISDTAGTVRVAAARTAKVRASGPGDVEVLGTPSCTVEALGSGGVKCGRR